MGQDESSLNSIQPPRAEAGPSGLDEAAVRGELRKILASPLFSASERMSRFVRFAVEQALAGRGGELKEYVLGLEIFDRDSSFDPRVDPIVRVEARRLRSKLKSYYESEGRNDGLVIEFPTGTYAPRFRARGEAVAPPRTAPARNIAVLPFTNLSPEPGSEYFSDGLTEELIHALTTVEGLRVVAWSTAAQLRNREDDIYSIGRQLNVAAVLVGSVRQAGGRLRIMARLVDTATGYYLWSETYDRQLEDLFAIQEEISRAIVDTLCIKLLGRGRAMARTPTNLEAYNLYLKGRFHGNQRTREGLERAIEYFREAVAIDPGFATGYAGLADAQSLLADHGLEPAAETMGQAKSAALRALDLDPNLAEAHTSLAFILSLYEWRWAEAGEHYRRAIRLSPGYVAAHHWYSCDYLALLGRMEEAVAEAKLAVQLDPLSPVIAESLAYVLLLARRYEEALEQSGKVAEMAPYFYKAYTNQGRAYIQMGRYAEAIQMLERGLPLAGGVPSVLGALGQAHALAGNHARARAILAELAEMAKKAHVTANAPALIHLGLGEKERALEWIEEGCLRHELGVANLKVHPAWDDLRAEPRFAALLRKIGLA